MFLVFFLWFFSFCLLICLFVLSHSGSFGFNLFCYYSIDDCFLTRDIRKAVDSDGRAGEYKGVARGKQ